MRRIFARVDIKKGETKVRGAWCMASMAFMAFMAYRTSRTYALTKAWNIVHVLSRNATVYSEHATPTHYLTRVARLNGTTQRNHSTESLNGTTQRTCSEGTTHVLTSLSQADSAAATASPMMSLKLAFSAAVVSIGWWVVSGEWWVVSIGCWVLGVGW